MIRMITQPYAQDEWNRIVEGFCDLSLMQTWEYAEAKTGDSSWKVERAIFEGNDGRVLGAVQAMIRYVPGLGKGLVWISRGPLWRGADETDVSTLVAMMNLLRQYWVVERGMYLRILPTLFQGEVDSDLFTKSGYRLVDGSILWASSLLDLSLPIEVLRSRLQQKWRNCLNKAGRQGIVAQSGVEDVLFNDLLLEYEGMLQRKSFVSCSPSLLSRLQSTLPDERKLWVVRGRLGSQSLGGVLIARYGQFCEYLVGTVNDAGKRINAGQLLLWLAITQMKEQGYRWFDLGGMDPVRTSKGIMHFKRGVNGSPYELMGEVESFNRSLLNQAIRWRVRHARNQLN